MNSPLLERLVVVGTGFMGASVAAGAKAAGLARQVVGIDPQEAATAQSLGWIDAACDRVVSLPEISGITAIVVAAPVASMSNIFADVETLCRHQPVAWMTDLGSTKAGVIVAAQAALQQARPRFVSSHPMAGSEKQGARHARADLLQGARVLISPLSESTESVVADVEAFWIAMGAQPSLLPIEDHDALLAAISHLPHLLAYSLASMLAQSSLAGAAQALHGGGLRDTTRIAASSADLWADIFLDNRERLLEAWDQWALHQQALRDALQKADRVLLIDLLDRAAHWRRGF